MHGNIPYLFDFWADPIVHLLLLKSSMVKPIQFSCNSVTMLIDFILNCIFDHWGLLIMVIAV